MKKGFLLITGCVFVSCAFAQGPTFMSPYKDGRPVPESQKNYATGPVTNMLVYTKKVDDKPAKAYVKPEAVVSGSENKQPAVANTKKKN